MKEIQNAGQYILLPIAYNEVVAKSFSITFFDCPFILLGKLMSELSKNHFLNKQRIPPLKI